MATASENLKNFLTEFLSSNEDNEKKLIYFIIHNPHNLHRITSELFFNKKILDIYNAIIKIIDSNIKVEPDVLLDFCRKERIFVDKEYIEDFFQSKYNTENIDYTVEKCKQFKIEYSYLQETEKIIISILDKKNLSVDIINKSFEKISQEIGALHNNHQLWTIDDFMNAYEKEIEERIIGIKKRSIGSPELDKHITRPGNGGEISILFGLKGTAKSICTKSFENYLINNNICVGSFNLEMMPVASADRLLCMRYGFSVEDLLLKNKDRRMLDKIRRAVKETRDLKNYIYYPDPYLNLNQLDSILYNMKQKFKMLGVLPDDEYIYLTFDTFDMLEDFDGADPLKIKSNVNKFHRILRKHNCHALIILQANENKLRSAGFARIKKPEDLDYYKLMIEDIEGGASYASRARVVMALNRPLQLKKQYFPERNEEWELEPDLINIHGIKQNEGGLFFEQFAFGDNFRIIPFKHKETKERSEDDF